jgi:hypothetical protein
MRTDAPTTVRRRAQPALGSWSPPILSRPRGRFCNEVSERAAAHLAIRRGRSGPHPRRARLVDSCARPPGWLAGGSRYRAADRIGLPTADDHMVGRAPAPVPQRRLSGHLRGSAPSLLGGQRSAGLSGPVGDARPARSRSLGRTADHCARPPATGSGPSLLLHPAVRGGRARRRGCGHLPRRGRRRSRRRAGVGSGLALSRSIRVCSLRDAGGPAGREGTGGKCECLSAAGL